MYTKGNMFKFSLKITSNCNYNMYSLGRSRDYRKWYAGKCLATRSPKEGKAP